MATLTPATLPPHGMLHVRVLRARNLPTMDFGKRQDPYVLVQLEGASPSVRGTTDPAFEGGTSPDWTDAVNRDIELFYEPAAANEAVVLRFDVFANESGEDLIGTAELNVAKIAHEKTAAPTEFTLRLKEAANGTANRGDLTVHVWYGPAVRKAFRLAQRAGLVLQARDYVINNVYSVLATGAAPVSQLLQKPVDYLKKNRNLSIALTGVVGAGLAAAVALFLLIATPTALVALFTFPFWIIPFLVTAFFTSPLWVPVLVVVGLFVAFVVMVVLGVSVTSQPVRRHGAKLSSRIKGSDVGKRVIYEGSA